MANTYSVDFERSDLHCAYINDGSQAGLDITGDITIEAWIKLEQLPSSEAGVFGIVTKQNYIDDERAWGFVIRNSDDKLVFTYSDDGTSGTHIIDFVCDEAFDSGDVNSWVHVAVVVDVSETSCIFYINGVAKNATPTSGNTPTSINDNNTPVVVGGAWWGGQPNWYFDGLMDDVRVWNYGRSSGQISGTKDTELVGNETGLVGYWKFNNDLTDSTSNNNDLTAYQPGELVTFSVDVPFVESTTTSTTTSTSTSSSTTVTTTSTSTTVTTTSTTTTSTSTSTTTTSTSTTQTTSTSTSTTLSLTTSTTTSTSSSTTTSTTTVAPAAGFTRVVMFSDQHVPPPGDDLTGWDADMAFEASKYSPDIVFTVGDDIQGHTITVANRDEAIARYISDMEKTGVTWYYAYGNWDYPSTQTELALADAGIDFTFPKTVQVGYYDFVILKPISDDGGSTFYIPDEDLTWLENNLSARPTIVIQHMNMVTNTFYTLDNQVELLDLLNNNGNVILVVGGHAHGASAYPIISGMQTLKMRNAGGYDGTKESPPTNYGFHVLDLKPGVVEHFDVKWLNKGETYTVSSTNTFYDETTTSTSTSTTTTVTTTSTTTTSTSTTSTSTSSSTTQTTSTSSSTSTTTTSTSSSTSTSTSTTTTNPETTTSSSSTSTSTTTTVSVSRDFVVEKVVSY